MLNHAHLPGRIDFRNRVNPHGLRYVEGDDGNGGGGSGGNNSGGDNGGSDGGGGDNQDPPAGDKGGSDGGSDKGFPDGTPIAEMTDKEQAAYWKHQSRKHEQAARDRSDYADLKRKADQFDQQQRENESEHEKALREARETAKAEGRTEAATEGARALIDGLLRQRGKDDDKVSAALRHINLTSFVTDAGQVDTKAVLDHITSIAGPATGNNNGGGDPDHGQGRRGANTKGTGVSAGREMFEAGRKQKNQQ